MSGWFQQQIVSTGRLPLFCFFVAFVVGFGFIRLSVRLIRARAGWWPGNIVTGDVRVHHMVFGPRSWPGPTAASSARGDP